ncbi:GHKL domain-containing protein [Pediococcus acidilactici]|uniref:GHKL domain-containing protein n=1 Tax=Pediococcus acidilactici TaxID=1254 RepID=UPI00325C86D0
MKRASKTNLREIFQEGYTTKGNHEGIGLSSLRDITAKEDHLEVMTSIENGYFLQEIVC